MRNGNWLRTIFALAVIFAMVGGCVATAEGAYSILIDSFDWGPGVTKVIMDLGVPIDAQSVRAEDFAVTEHKQYMDFQIMSLAEGDFERIVVDAYVSDESGAKLESEGAFVTLEMAVDPNSGNPFYYDLLGTTHNEWADPYQLIVSLKQGAALTSAGASVTELAIGELPAGKIMPKSDNFEAVDARLYAGNVMIGYSFYTPPQDDKQNALLIWLHGAGEGGSHKEVVLMGNKVSALGQPEIQDLFGGAYVLCPQAPTMWMDNGEKNPDTGAPMYVHDGNFVSIYTEGLMELIDTFVKEHEDIDPAKVIIGGCSNGGYMTVNMLIHHADKFLAAYPICEAYQDNWIGDEQLQAIASVPTWFTYAEDDTTVDPLLNAAPTVERLKAIGANVQLSVFPNVVDTSGLYKTPDGAPHQYMGHWSWLYTLNNQCIETIDGQEVAIWNWLADLAK